MSTPFKFNKEILYRQNLEAFKCSFCLSLLNVPMMTTCFHLFCNACIITHFENKNFCPSCKSKTDLQSIRFAPKSVFKTVRKLNRIKNDPKHPYNSSSSLINMFETITVEDDAEEIGSQNQNKRQTGNKNISDDEGDDECEEEYEHDESDKESMMKGPRAASRKSEFSEFIKMCEDFYQKLLSLNLETASEDSMSESSSMENLLTNARKPPEQQAHSTNSVNCSNTNNEMTADIIFQSSSFAHQTKESHVKQNSTKFRFDNFCITPPSPKSKREKQKEIPMNSKEMKSDSSISAGLQSINSILNSPNQMPISSLHSSTNNNYLGSETASVNNNESSSLNIDSNVEQMEVGTITTSSPNQIDDSSSINLRKRRSDYTVPKMHPFRQCRTARMKTHRIIRKHPFKESAKPPHKKF